MSFRWTEEQLAHFDRKAKQWKKDNGVHTHICKGPPKPATPKKPRAADQRSRLEAAFEELLLGLPRPVTQHLPIEGRKWSLDFAWPDRKLGVEVQGMVHRIRDKFKRDIEKRANLMLAGWRVLEVDGEAIKDGRARRWMEKLLGTR